MCKISSTEEKIKEAAKRVFITKGFSACTSREIAKEAGMNVALVNYYFRSKNQLFLIIYHAVMHDFMLSMMEVFSTELSLKEKVSLLIDREYEFLTKHPEIPTFVLNEMARNKDSGIQIHETLNDFAKTGVFLEASNAQKRGEMRKVDMVSLTMIIMANCQHPFMARLLTQQLHGMTDDQYDTQIIKHKEIIKEMILNYLFPTKSANE
jgi:TetR/AcrR family transcriptional regulator